MSDIRVTAKLSDGIHATAQIANVVEVPVAPDVYTGEYDITAPSEGSLTLPTKDKLMTDDVTIEANHTIEDELLWRDDVREVYRNERITTLAGYRFYETKFKKIYLPNVTYCGTYAFYGTNVSYLEEVYIPRAKQIGSNIFVRNPYLRIIDIAKFSSGIVNVCPVLTTMILRMDTMWQPVANSFANCPYAVDGEGGYIYVPQSLLASYRSSANWQNYANVLEFRPIEGSEYELEE